MLKRKKQIHQKSYQEREREEHAVKVVTDIVHLQWENANPNVTVLSIDPSSDYYTYPLEHSTVPNTQSSSGSFVANAYKKIVYQNLYPGIDVEYTFHPDQGIKYVLVVHPGADASVVKMKWTGADKISSDESGNMHLATVFGDIVDHAPVTYYLANASSLKPTNINSRRGASIESKFIRNGKSSFLRSWKLRFILKQS